MYAIDIQDIGVSFCFLGSFLTSSNAGGWAPRNSIVFSL
jgi:hypothetical protein